jgi:hypothetical protein
MWPDKNIDCFTVTMLADIPSDHSILTVHIHLNAVAQWLRYCATNWKVAGSIPDGVIGIFH